MLAPALWVPWKATVSVPTCQKEQGLREVLQRLWWELLTASSTSWLLLKAYVGRADCCFLQNVMWAELKKPFEMSKPEPRRHEVRQLQQLYIPWSPKRASCLFFSSSPLLLYLWHECHPARSQIRLLTHPKKSTVLCWIDSLPAQFPELV